MAFDLGEALRGVSELNTGREQIEYIRLELIDEDPNNFYLLSDIDQLAANIELCGLQQPIRVRPIPDSDRYMIVSGHRRRKAIELLAKDDPEKWAEVACIVENDTASRALQQLRLIYANANTRKMTPAETSRQAEEVTNLLYQLKEEGYEFPGRMRDHVAEAVGVSKTKLARLKVIRENLDECWMSYFESDQLHETSAYYLAQLPKDEQFFIFDYMEGTRGSASSVSAAIVEAYKNRLAAMTNLTCPTDGGPCENLDYKREATIRTGLYDHHSCGKCCASCVRLTTCLYACPKLADLIAQQKAEQLEKIRRQKAITAEKDAPVIEQITRLWHRFCELRENSGVSVDLARNFSGCSPAFSAKQFTALERGARISTTTPLPFSFLTLRDIERLVELANLFGCSLDDLLGRTEKIGIVSAPNTIEQPEKVSAADTIWHPISEEPPVGVDLVWVDAHGYSDTGEYLGGQQIETVSTISFEEARWWAELPKED